MKKVAFVFPGQGAQYQGMGKREYESFQVVREVFEEASHFANRDLKKLCFDTDTKELMKTNNAQLATFTTSYAMFKAFIERGIKPSYMAGHSLGEITALTCSGAMAFKDAVKIVQQRGDMMQSIAEKSEGKMVAIKAIDLHKLKELCEKYSRPEDIVVIANINSLEQIIISGHTSAVQKVINEVTNLNGTYTALKVNAPFHSPIMHKMLEPFKEVLMRYTYSTFSCPVISNITAMPYTSKNDIVEHLTKHIVSPVLWKDTVAYLAEHKVDMCIELGPKSVLTQLGKNITKQIKAFSYDDLTDDQLLETYINQAKRTTVITMCLASAICVKNRNWDDEAYREGVIEPYKKLKKIQMAIENENREPSQAEEVESIHLLQTIFTTKKVPQEEQEIRFKQIKEVSH